VLLCLVSFPTKWDFQACPVPPIKDTTVDLSWNVNLTVLSVVILTSRYVLDVFV
jgi:hypothetical protein